MRHCIICDKEMPGSVFTKFCSYDCMLQEPEE